MAKVHFRDYNPKQIILFPQRLDKDIAENDPVRIVDTIVDQLKLGNFGQMKYDMNYKRFRHFGMDKVKMDFAFFAIAFNIKKMCSKINKKGKGKPFGATNTAYFCLLAVLTTIETTENGILTKKSA